MLHLVWYQLELFPLPELSADDQAVEDAERDRRSCLSWQKSILSYLEFGAGDSWRRLSDPEHRNSPERLWYLNGLRLMYTIMTGGLPRSLWSPEKKADDIQVRKLATKARGWLVDELMQANPRLVDRRLLSHLSRPKLAGMIVEARNERAAALERSA